eukprot:Clim_evm7s62 gene=Clim_evmTU7s62
MPRSVGRPRKRGRAAGPRSNRTPRDAFGAALAEAQAAIQTAERRERAGVRHLEGLQFELEFMPSISSAVGPTTADGSGTGNSGAPSLVPSTSGTPRVVGGDGGDNGVGLGVIKTVLDASNPIRVERDLLMERMKEAPTTLQLPKAGSRRVKGSGGRLTLSVQKPKPSALAGKNGSTKGSAMLGPELALPVTTMGYATDTVMGRNVRYREIPKLKYPDLAPDVREEQAKQYYLFDHELSMKQQESTQPPVDGEGIPSAMKVPIGGRRESRKRVALAIDEQTTGEAEPPTQLQQRRSKRQRRGSAQQQQKQQESGGGGTFRTLLSWFLPIGTGIMGDSSGGGANDEADDSVHSTAGGSGRSSVIDGASAGSGTLQTPGLNLSDMKREQLENGISAETVAPNFWNMPWSRSAQYVYDAEDEHWLDQAKQRCAALLINEPYRSDRETAKDEADDSRRSVDEKTAKKATKQDTVKHESADVTSPGRKSKSNGTPHRASSAAALVAAELASPLRAPGMPPAFDMTVDQKALDRRAIELGWTLECLVIVLEYFERNSYFAHLAAGSYSGIHHTHPDEPDDQHAMGGLTASRLPSPRRGVHTPLVKTHLTPQSEEKTGEEGKGVKSSPSINPNTATKDDALCAVCGIGDSEGMNQIIFCESCALAVHQDCYGVPFIPDHAWVCRRCMVAPSQLVRCQLCPNVDGAFKQASRSRSVAPMAPDGGNIGATSVASARTEAANVAAAAALGSSKPRLAAQNTRFNPHSTEPAWAHIVCADYVPECGFANPVYREPIDDIELIPESRWKLKCYICERTGVGASIQCSKSHCYTAFHVTCGFRANLFRRNGPDTDQSGDPVKRMYCHEHTPADADFAPVPHNVLKEVTAAATVSQSYIDRKLHRKLQKEVLHMVQRTYHRSKPTLDIVMMPVVPLRRLEWLHHSMQQAGIGYPGTLIRALYAYWQLKRWHNRGAPLVRALQVVGTAYEPPTAIEDLRSAPSEGTKGQFQTLSTHLAKAERLAVRVERREQIKADRVRALARMLEVVEKEAT